MNEVGAIYDVSQTRVNINIFTLLCSLDFYSVYFKLIHRMLIDENITIAKEACSSLLTPSELSIYIILPPTKQGVNYLIYTVRFLYYRLGVMILRHLLTTKQRLLTKIINIAIITSVGFNFKRKTIQYAYIDENGNFNHASEEIRKNEDNHLQVGNSFSMMSGSYSLKHKSGGSRRSKKYVRRWFKKPKSKKSKPNSKSKTKPKTKRRASIN